jgi:MFS family permease
VTEPVDRVITRGFVALFAATLAFFIAGGIALPVAPQYAERVLLATPSEVGLSIAIFSIAALAMRPVVGWSSDRFGRRPVLLIGATVAIAAFGVHLVAGTLGVFVGARALLGVGEAFFFVASIAMASDLAPSARRGEAISLFSLSIYAGLAVGPWIGETALSAGSWPLVWIVAGATSGVALALALTVAETVPAAEPGQAIAGVEGRRGPVTRLIHPAGILPGFLIFLGVFGMAGFLAFVPLYVEDVGLPASLPLGIYAVIVIGLRIVGAKLPDRLGAVRLSGAALVATAAGLAIMGVVRSAPGLILGTATMAVGVAFTFPALVSLAVARVAPTERGTLVGTTTVFLDLAFGVAPLVLGWIATGTGYGPTFLVSAVLAGAGSALLFGLRGSLQPPVESAPARPARVGSLNG